MTVILLVLVGLMVFLLRAFMLRRRRILKGLPVRGPWRWPRFLTPRPGWRRRVWTRFWTRTHDR
jgi:hypothetical protein